MKLFVCLFVCPFSRVPFFRGGWNFNGAAMIKKWEHFFVDRRTEIKCMERTLASVDDLKLY